MFGAGKSSEQDSERLQSSLCFRFHVVHNRPLRAESLATPAVEDYPYAVTSQRLLYIPPAGNGHDANTLLAYFIEGHWISLEPSGSSLFRFPSDSNRRCRIALVHLGVLFERARDISTS